MVGAVTADGGMLIEMEGGVRGVGNGEGIDVERGIVDAVLSDSGKGDVDSGLEACDQSLLSIGSRGRDGEVIGVWQTWKR